MGAHPKATCGVAPPLGLLHRALIGQQRGRLGNEHGTRSQRGICDRIPSMLPLPVGRTRGHLVVESLHEVINRQGCSQRPSSSAGGERLPSEHPKLAAGNPEPLQISK